MRQRSFPRILAAAAALSSAGCLRAPAPSATASAPVPVERRAIVLSLDSFNEARLRASLPAAAIPAIRSLLDAGACAASARPAFPSVTAAGHASLWTGAYGDVSGITGNLQPRLPRDQHTILDATSGFIGEQLRAEPVWITAALQGVAVAGHHTTQAPGTPGYRDVLTSQSDPTLTYLRARADAAMTSPLLHLVNGYDSSLVAARVITHETARLRRVQAWPGSAAAFDGSVAPLETAVALGTAGDSLFILLAGSRGTYDKAIVAPVRDAARGVTVRAHAAESALPAGRALARHFSGPLALTIGSGRARTHVRLFDLAPDGSSFTLFLPAIAVIASNHEETRASYDSATAWVGNSASALLTRGDLGPTLLQGGDGTAERRWLETAELMTRESIRGAQWMWRSRQPRLFLDYFALGDDTDHTFWGIVSRESAGYDAAVARTAQAVRAHAWALVDRRVAAVREMASASGAALFVSGDHGMRATWRTFRANVLLARAGLLALGANGQIDLSRSAAVSPNGYWISVNRVAWRDGIVSPAREREVIDSVSAILRSAHGPDGQPIVSRIYVATEHDSLGLGGPTGGDVYFGLAEGYSYDGGTSGDVTGVSGARGAHGFPSVDADMHTALCASGPGFSAHRLPPARTIDLAPTVLEWVGVEPAVTVRGRSLLDGMRR